MDRRHFVAVASLAATSAGQGLPQLDPSAAADGADLPRPNAAQLAWQRAGLGALIHWDLPVFGGRGYNQRRNWREAWEDPDIFRPTDYDIDQWFEAIVGMGAQFAILTASHETGFGLWQSDATPYCLKAVSWMDGKADIVGDFCEAARRHGVKPGIYMGTRFNSHFGVMHFKVTERSPITQAEYNHMIELEVEEICGRYGELFELWFDGGSLAPEDGGPDVLPIFEGHQPHCLFYGSKQRRDARWGGAESGVVPYPCWSTSDIAEVESGAPHSAERAAFLGHGLADGPDFMPAMSDAPLRGANGFHEWVWTDGSDKGLYAVDQLMAMYEASVGRNSTLVIGLTADTRGRIAEPDTRRCIEWGTAIREQSGAPVAVGSGIGDEVDLALGRATNISAAVIEEELQHGQRVREYGLVGLAGGEWIRLATGTAIGAKRIDRFPATEVTHLKLLLRQSAAAPMIARLAVH